MVSPPNLTTLGSSNLAIEADGIGDWAWNPKGFFLIHVEYLAHALLSGERKGLIAKLGADHLEPGEDVKGALLREGLSLGLSQHMPKTFWRRQALRRVITWALSLLSRQWKMGRSLRGSLRVGSSVCFLMAVSFSC